VVSGAPTCLTQRVSMARDRRAHQQVIQARCFHPTGPFIEFPAEDLDRSIPDRFARQVRRYSDRVAVKTSGRSLTYAELDQASDRVAHAILARRGAQSEPVAAFLDKDASMIVAMLGVLKAGKIFLALDPTHPSARNTGLLDDAEPALVLTTARTRSAAPDLDFGEREPIDVDDLTSRADVKSPGVSVPAEASAALVYTSGITGRPKAVVHTHRSLLHLVMHFTNVAHVSSHDRLALLQPLTVVGGARNPWIALLNGAALYPLDLTREGLLRLAAWLREEKITICHFVPTLFRHLAASLPGTAAFPDLRVIRLGGESVSRQDFALFKKHFDPGAVLLVTYNTSEASTIGWYLADATTTLDGDRVPVGFARAGTEVILLDDHGQRLSPGEVGEIAVRSRYLARGYWRRPELTAERFLPDPDGGDQRIYRTGDLGQLFPDGCLVHLGRKDSQVQVRGFRVEPGEIEAALRDDPAIRESVVVAHHDGAGEVRLVAYLVPARVPAPLISDVRSRLEARLPTHLVPSAFVVLDALPLTTNGKVDLRALPPPDRSRPRLEEPPVTPRIPMEEELARIWAGALDLEVVGVCDRFLDLGGTSLSATRIIAGVQAAFGVDIPLRSLLDAPTVADMAQVVIRALVAAATPEALARALAEADGALGNDTP